MATLEPDPHMDPEPLSTNTTGEDNSSPKETLDDGTIPHVPHEEMDPSTSTSTAQTSHKPTVVIVIGMAGSGKSTFMQRLNLEATEKGIRSYTINLDPAVQYMPFGANIDIRDTVDYKQVMKQYKLGPNGAIMTSMNLFATKFDQVLEFAEKRAGDLDYIFVDTPGQIEVFTWSASGSIITEALASSFPTVLAYVVDTPRTTHPVTFMSNMLYACSIMYKAKLPFTLVFNKTDVASHQFALDWMNDFELYQEALDGETSYISTFSRSMSLMLDEFYSTISATGVSSITGQGMDDLFEGLSKGRKEYYDEYIPAINEKKRLKEERQKKRKEKEMRKLQRDMGQKVVLDGGSVGQDSDDDSLESDLSSSDDDEDEEEEHNRDGDHDSFMRFLNK